MTETSPAKIAANRKNAQKSTGPKNTTRSRLNDLKHGLLTKELLLDGEDSQTLKQFGKRLRTELAPQSELELLLVERIISSTWRLRRAIQVERSFLQAVFDDYTYDNWHGTVNSDNKIWEIVISRQLGTNRAWLNLICYETAIEKQIYKALHELMRIQSARNGEKPAL